MWIFLSTVKSTRTHGGQHVNLTKGQRANSWLLDSQSDVSLYKVGKVDTALNYNGMELGHGFFTTPDEPGMK